MIASSLTSPMLIMRKVFSSSFAISAASAEETECTILIAPSYQAVAASLQAGVMQDLRLWSNKIHRARPLYCEGDKNLVEFRRWAKQFYSEPA